VCPSLLIRTSLTHFFSFFLMSLLVFLKNSISWKKLIRSVILKVRKSVCGMFEKFYFAGLKKSVDLFWNWVLLWFQFGCRIEFSFQSLYKWSVGSHATRRRRIQFGHLGCFWW
jgi:hypothetical protein